MADVRGSKSDSSWSSRPDESPGVKVIRCLLLRFVASLSLGCMTSSPTILLGDYATRSRRDGLCGFAFLEVKVMFDRDM